MASDTAPALVLPLERAGSGEPQTVAGLPGRWVPGQAYSLHALGLSESEARRLLAEVPNPLEWTEVPAEEAWDAFRRPAGSHAPSSLARPEDEREREAVQTAADPIVSDDGTPIHPGVVPPERSAGPLPAWVEAARRDATALSQGRTADPRAEGLKAQVKEEVRDMTKGQLVERAAQLGIPNADSTLKDALADLVIEREHAVIDRPDEPHAFAPVEVEETVDAGQQIGAPTGEESEPEADA